MITIDRLQASEFDLLKNVGDGFMPDPTHSIAVVARNSAGIIGRVFIVAPAHVEGIFIEEAWRNGPIMKQLVQAAELEAKVEGIEQLLVFGYGPQMEDYIERLGYKKLSLSVWEKRLVCPQH